MCGQSRAGMSLSVSFVNNAVDRFGVTADRLSFEERLRVGVSDIDPLGAFPVAQHVGDVVHRPRKVVGNAVEALGFLGRDSSAWDLIEAAGVVRHQVGVAYEDDLGVWRLPVDAR